MFQDIFKRIFNIFAVGRAVALQVFVSVKVFIQFVNRCSLPLNVYQGYVLYSALEAVKEEIS